jgi:hypothetical protein
VSLTPIPIFSWFTIFFYLRPHFMQIPTLKPVSKFFSEEEVWMRFEWLMTWALWWKDSIFWYQYFPESVISQLAAERDSTVVFSFKALKFTEEHSYSNISNTIIQYITNVLTVHLTDAIHLVIFVQTLLLVSVVG